MTVQDIIDELKKHDPALEVVVSGRVSTASKITSVLKTNPPQEKRKVIIVVAP